MPRTGLGWFFVVLIVAAIGAIEAIRHDRKIAHYWNEKPRTRR